MIPVQEILAVAMFLVASTSLTGAIPSRVTDPYVCPMGDAGQFEKPGDCPTCHMTLVHRSEVNYVGILIFPGVQIIDYTGPYEVFGQGGCIPFTVAKSAAPLKTSMGMNVTPAYTLANAPQPDVIVIPGGDVDATVSDPEVIAWIRANAPHAKYVMSVCNGAYILAKTGLIDGLTATTYYGLLDDFEHAYPQVHTVRDRRFADNGKFISTAGLSSGIDGALHVIEKLKGRGVAQSAALNMEYDWHQDATYARASFADRHLHRIFGRRLNINTDGVKATLNDTQGGREKWDVEWHVTSKLSPTALLSNLDQALTTKGKWERGTHPAASGDTRGAWRFKDEAGSRWTGSAAIARSGAGAYRVTLHIAKG